MRLCDFKEQLRAGVQSISKRPMAMKKVDELEIILALECRLEARTKKV